MNQTLPPEVESTSESTSEATAPTAERPGPFATAISLLAKRQQQSDEARELEKAAAWKTYAGVLAAPHDEADPELVAAMILILGLPSDEVERHVAMVARYRDSQNLAHRREELMLAAHKTSEEFKRLRSELPRALNAAEAENDRARHLAGKASRALNSLSQFRQDLPELADGGLFILLDQQHAAAVAEATAKS